MREKGPENEFQTRNRWVPPTPDELLARSNGISVDGNGNQVRGRISGELLGLLNRSSQQTSNYNRGGDNFHSSAQLNQISGSYGISDHRLGNRILTSGNSSNITTPLNQSSSLKSMSNYQMGNGIFTSSNRSDLTMNLSNYQIGHGITKGGNNLDLNRPVNQISSSNNMVNCQMGNGILTSDLCSNFTKPQCSGSNNMSNNQRGNVIFTSGNISNLTVDLSNYQLENGILEGGNTINLNRPINQISSSNNMINHRTGNGVITSNHSSNFIKPPSQSSSSYNMSNYQMGNGNFGTYLNSQTQRYCNNIPSSSNNPMDSKRGLTENSVQQPSFFATNMPPNMISIPDPVISSPIFNLNMQPLSPPRGMNSQVDLPNAPSILNSYSEVDSSWTHGNFTSLLLGDEILDLGPNEMLYSSNSPQMLNNELHKHVQHHNLNSPPRNAGTNDTNSFPFAPITPDHTNLLEKHRQAQMLKFFVDDSSYQEHDKMANLISSIGNETIENHCSELLKTIAGSSSTAGSTPQMENQITEERDNCIDLNETPKQKTPKRRKHRPKVVIEGKPKRTPKAKTPNKGETEKTPSKKRKYVRKNRDSEVENTIPLRTDVINTDKGPNLESQTESCRKRLNFDFDKTEEGENQHAAADVQVAHHQVLDLNLSFPVDQMIGTSSEIVNYNPLNIMTTDTSRRFKENRASRKKKRESNKKISRANVNLESSKEMRWKSTHQMVERDVGNFKGFGGSKEEKNENVRSEVGDSSEGNPEKQNMEMNFNNMLCGSEKGCDINGTSGESTIFTENYTQGKVTALNQEMVQEGMRENVTPGYLAVATNSNLQSPIPSKKTKVSGSQENPENYQANMQNNSIKMAENTCKEVSLCTNKVPMQDQKISKTARGRPKVFKYSKKTVDEITSRMRSLSISSEYEKDKYALVPYGGGGAVVLFEPKKRKPRPKVDLDPETDRIWKLLMGKEGAETSEGENRNKEKWWEEERRVFQGRAESFIARMHLVQGNRRFSPWKGSVVDSVIGVFLTQNVSDQLSSSAFMALAAQFPLGSETTFQSSEESGKSIVTEEPEIQGLSPYGTIKCFEKNASSSGNSSASSINHINGDFQSSSGSSSEGENSFNEENPIKNIGLTSVQNANVIPPLPAFKNSENMGVCFDDRSMLYHKQSLELDPNRHIQGLERFSNFSNSTPLNHMIASSFFSTEKSNRPPNYFQLLMASQVTRSETDCCEISREEYKSFFPSKAPEMAKENGLKNSHTPNIDPFGTLMKHPTVQKSSVNQIPQVEPLPSNTYQMENSQIYETKHRGFENNSGSFKPVSPRKNSTENQIHSVTRHSGEIVDSLKGTSAANNQVFLGDKYEKNIGVSAKNLKSSTKNDKARESFDWDSLRKTVQLNGGVRERNMDSSDSMDYEAMRCADVNVISNSIRIRGMNNMLSERIKDFLDRVVTDHGSIDLEWLRDVPPDKAKDYLLSVRGLGLKSVECVRLLTLHHLAFPVDTNVGRIAVRLGWVPLQPLPESLQLHLLEMYPVLETVQKYLWPRLCKLDQKTLYELHYQLITFGKVFCTKSKPNCNACPMRGECRHFASAFASARLALPAPEEKSIVSSTAPITTDRRADVEINPMLLQLLGINIEREREMMVRRCEPIIEEPATPEPELTEIAETDIEDAFYEDPDEIPTIRLNVEQLAVNLRSFMEENTDFKEEDMSKALVALAPEVASIPAPKLKYVLRLRTERQVYVLTDAHPLVKGLDKREPDDPSPYLLALLGPGEEANSDQASNGSEELCNNREANSSTVRGTLLIPCRTAMKGSFPLNGTYFQVNEVFADHESSLKPIDVPREWLWSLETRTVFFGTSATSIFRGMTTKEIQNTCWRGFVCVRGFDRKTRAPRPLNRNLHLTQNKTGKKSNEA